MMLLLLLMMSHELVAGPRSTPNPEATAPLVIESCSLLRDERTPPRDVPDETITLQVPQEVERAVFEDFVGEKWRACKHRSVIEIHGVGGHMWKLVLTAKEPLYPSPAFADEPEVAPTSTPVPTATPAPPLCSEVNPSLTRCLQVQDPAAVLNQRVTQLEQNQAQIIQAIQKMLPTPAAAAKKK